MIRRKFSCKDWIFNGWKRVIKSALGLLVHLDDETFTNQTLNLNFILDQLSKDKFLFSVSKFLSKSMSVFL